MFDGESQTIQVLDRFLTEFWSKLGLKTAPRRAKSRPRPKQVSPKAGSKKRSEKHGILIPQSPPIFLILWAVAAPGRGVLTHLDGKKVVFAWEVLQIFTFRGTPDLRCP